MPVFALFIAYTLSFRGVGAAEVEKLPVTETKTNAHDYPEYSPVRVPHRIFFGRRKK